LSKSAVMTSPTSGQICLVHPYLDLSVTTLDHAINIHSVIKYNIAYVINILHYMMLLSVT